MDDTLLASLPAESVPTSIVRISDLAEIETLPPTTALKQSAPNSTVKTTSHTAFHVQTRVLDSLERQAAVDASLHGDEKAPTPRDSGCDQPSVSSSTSSALPEVHTADAPDDGVVHYNAIRVAAPTIDTGDFLRDAAAAAPRYITFPVRPSPFQSSSVAASPLHVASHLSTSLRPAPTTFGVCNRPVWAFRRSSQLRPPLQLCQRLHLRLLLRLRPAHRHRLLRDWRFRLRHVPQHPAVYTTCSLPLRCGRMRRTGLSAHSASTAFPSDAAVLPSTAARR